MTNEVALRRYCTQVRRNLPCGRKKKKRILEEIRISRRHWAEEHPGTSFAEFEKAFGSPKEIAAAQLEQMNSSELLSKLAVRKKAFRVVFLVAIAVILLWASVVTWAAIDSYQYTRGELVEYQPVEEGKVDIRK